MSVAEGVSGRIAYKAYASGVIAANAQAVSASDLGASGGQILRRIGSSIKLGKDTYQSQEVRADRQIADFRHGMKRVEGSVNGEFSPATYADFFEAAFRGTWAAALSKSNSEFTSVSASSSTSKFIFTGGNPVTEGFRVGHIIRFTNLSDADNNAKNFLITGFGGTSNREVSVYPPPDTMTADSAFTVVNVKSLYVPSSSFVSRKFGIEVWNQDLDIARLFTECRVGGFTMGLPATGISTLEFPFMGRDLETYSAGAAPFLTSPTAENTEGVFAAVNGLLRIGGTNVGVVTGANIQMDLSPSTDPVVGQNYGPEIILGRANVTGQLTALFESLTLLDYFRNETSVEVLLYLTTTSAVNSPAVAIHLPSVKFGDAGIGDQGEGSQSITMPFQALKYGGSSPGVEATTILISDTQVA